MDQLRMYLHRLNTTDVVFGTEFACVFYLSTICFFLFFPILFLLFADFTLATYGFIGFHILVSLVLFLVTLGISEGFKRLVLVLYEVLNVKDVNKMDPLVGLGTLAMLGMMATISQFFVKSSVYVWLHGILLYNVTCILLSSQFFTNVPIPSDHLTVRNLKWCFSSGFLHFMLFLLVGYIGVCYCDTAYPMLALLVFGPISIPSATEFFLILAGGLEKQSHAVRRIAPVITVSKNIAVVAPIKEHDSRIECDVCLLEYSYSQYPRILKECGHTICETCADKLLKKNNGKFILCPFCQIMTITNGPVSNLSKNHAVFDVVRELNA